MKKGIYAAILPTSDPHGKHGIVKWDNKFYYYEHNDSWGFRHHYLYVLSDDTIQEGDSIGYFNLNWFTPVVYLGGDLTGGEKKIIYSTDPNIKNTVELSVKDIRTIVSEYNIGKHKKFLLLSQRNGSFSANKIKDTWNKKDVLKLIKSAYKEGYQDKKNEEEFDEERICKILID